jgi:hypothetical protein
VVFLENQIPRTSQMEQSDWSDFITPAPVLYSHIHVLITRITGNFGKFNTQEPPNEVT